MTPLRAWLAMTLDGPVEYRPSGLHQKLYATFLTELSAESFGPAPPQRVLIVPDTEENRRKLGMEEV